MCASKKLPMYVNFNQLVLINENCMMNGSNYQTFLELPHFKLVPGGSSQLYFKHYMRYILCYIQAKFQENIFCLIITDLFPNICSYRYHKLYKNVVNTMITIF